MVVAAHPDDEVLGCGGTIARHTSHGDQVFIVILAEGMMARAKKKDDAIYRNEQKRLKESSLKAASVLGAREIIHYDFPDNRMDSVDLLEVIKAIEKCIDKYSPEVVYTHHAGDLNIDHSTVAKAVVTVTRPLYENRVQELYAFEVLSSTEWNFSASSEHFGPNYFVEINDHLDKKIKALSCYVTETPPFPHPRSIEAIRTLAARRGSQSGLEAAEAFMLLRKIVQQK
ncbi:MAG: PIG-L deacetylase family protein [Desulfatiglandales bacterium]|nr:PIG-L deacetylase family protein [Desulfatiglandales bacterium]